MAEKVRWPLTLAAWAVLLYGALGVASLPLDDWGHGLCGVWGCLPPVQAVAAMHAFWALALALPAGWLASQARPERLRLAGAVLALAGGAVLLMLTVRDALDWSRGLPPELQRYLPRRVLLYLATRTRWPLVELPVMGLYLYSAGRRRIPGSAGAPQGGGEGVISGHPPPPPLARP